MSAKHVAGILGDYTTNDQSQQSVNARYGQTPSNNINIIKPSQNGIVSLLTPPSSDVEAEAQPSRLHHSRQPLHQSLLKDVQSPLDHVSREETIRKLLERKEMLEAYLKALAESSQLETSKSPDSPILQSAASTPQSESLHRKYRMVRKVTTVNRVRRNIHRLSRWYRRPAEQVAFVNTIQIGVCEEDVYQKSEGNDSDDADEEIVFKPFRSTLFKVEEHSTRDLKTSEGQALSKPKPTLEEQRSLLLQTIFAPLQLLPISNDKSTRKPSAKLKQNHVLTSNQLRDLRQKNATITENNPVRYPRGHVASPNIRLHSVDRDTSDAETTIGAVETTIVILAAPARPEILDRIEAVARSLQETFPLQAELLEPFIQDPRTGLSMVYDSAAGIDAGFTQVLWDNGVGTLGMDEATRKAIPSGNVHIFMDHSNVFLSLDATLRENPLPDLPRYKRKVLSLPVLSLILQRGRAVHPKGLHLAGSSPLMQSFDPAIKLGWECSILKRVPAGAVMQDLEQGAVDDDRPKHHRKGSKWHDKPTVRFDLSDSLGGNRSHSERVPPARQVLSATSDYETTSCSESEARARTNIRYANKDSSASTAPCLRVNNRPSAGKLRMKEQAVDELLHLKILQTILAHRGKRPGTIVLATGDARGGQYNEHGFLGCVREAIARGWQVELWAFKNGMSRSWADCARREGWLESGRFVVWELDNWIRELTQVVE